LFSLTRAHENHDLRYLADRPLRRIVQPLSKGTAPAILSTLTRGPGCGRVDSSLRSLLFLRERLQCGVRAGSEDRAYHP
jgi:hypothetical protein